jgi:transposase
MVMRRDLAKERYWREIVERQRQSGLSVRGFCRREGVSEPGFHGWRRELTLRDLVAQQPPKNARPARRQAVRRSSSFVPLAVTASAPLIEVCLPQGVRLAVHAGADAHLLREVLSALEERLC